MKQRILLLLVIISVVALPVWSDDFTMTFSGAQTYSGVGSTSGPGGLGTLTAHFFDVSNGTCGVASQTGVCLVLTSDLNTNNGIQENVDPGKGFYFNLVGEESNSAALLSGLSFALKTNTGFATAGTLGTGDDTFKADGLAGQFDTNLTWSGATKAFTNGESQTYLITDSNGAITADNFLNSSDVDLQTLGGCNSTDLGSCVAAIHVQNTASNGQNSGWEGVFGTTGGGGGITGGQVPEPKYLGISLIGFGLIFLFSRKRRQNA